MPGAPTPKLLAIADALNRDLTQLLGIVTSRDEERDNLRRELQKARDQLAELLILQATPTPSVTTSRPVSHVSLSDCETTTFANAELETEQAATDNQSLHLLTDTSNEILVLQCESELNEVSELLVEKASSDRVECNA